MKLNKEEISVRLKKFIDDNYNSISEAAEHLDLSESSLRGSYLNGKSLPGFEALYQFHSEGCDLEWLLTGKRNLWTLTFEVRVRINAKIKEIKELYSISDDNLNLEKIEIEEYAVNKKLNMIPNEFHARTIYYHWKVDESISIPQLIKLSEILEIDLAWFLTGEQKSDAQTQNALLFKYPEIALLMELRKNPVLFKKVKLYVDSVTSSTSSSELDKISKEINSLEDQNSIAQTKKKED